MICKRCKRRKAEAPEVSVFSLCETCAEAVYPGSDIERYQELRRLYGR